MSSKLSSILLASVVSDTVSDCAGNASKVSGRDFWSDTELSLLCVLLRLRILLFVDQIALDLGRT